MFALKERKWLFLKGIDLNRLKGAGNPNGTTMKFEKASVDTIYHSLDLDAERRGEHFYA
jgi:hypothetical protein